MMKSWARSSVGSDFVTMQVVSSGTQAEAVNVMNFSAKCSIICQQSLTMWCLWLGEVVRWETVHWIKMIYPGLYGHPQPAKEETISLERDAQFAGTQQEHSGYAAYCTVCIAKGFASAWKLQCRLYPYTSHLIRNSVCTASPLQASEELEPGLLTSWILQLLWDCSEKPQLLGQRDSFFLICLSLFSFWNSFT